MTMSHNDITSIILQRWFELSLFLDNMKILKNLKKIAGVISSVKFELQNLKWNFQKTCRIQNDINMIFIIKYEDHGLENKIWINIEKRWNSYAWMYKNIACNINELTLYLQKVTKSIKKIDIKNGLK